MVIAFAADIPFNFRILFYSNTFLRYVPVEDLLEIYKQLYGREVITRSAIIDCSYLQFLEM